MAARRPCMAHVAQGIFARNCQLANAGSRLAGKSRSLRLQTGAAPYACLGAPWRRVPRQVGEPCLRFFFFLFFCSESSRISRARSPSRVSRLRHSQPKRENSFGKCHSLFGVQNRFVSRAGLVAGLTNVSVFAEDPQSHEFPVHCYSGLGTRTNRLNNQVGEPCL